MGFLEKMFGKGKNQDENFESYKRDQGSYRPDFDSINELGQISSIFEWVFNPDDSIANEAAKIIYRVLHSQTAFKNKTLYNSLKYINLKKIDLKRFDRFNSELKQSLLCVSSMNGNGHVREEALVKLCVNPTNFSFPFILFRLGDWVLPIKKKAEEIVRGLIISYKPEFLIRHHKIIDWLLKVQRNDLKEIHSEITAFIFSDQNINQAIKSINKYSEGDRYYIYKNLIKRNQLTPSILGSILTDNNFLIRLLAVKNVELQDKPGILKKLLNDKSQKIRHYAINKIEEQQIPDFKDILIRLIFDNSGPIRAISRDLLSKIEKIDFYQIYSQSFNQKPTIGNIIGLSEVGSKDDVNKLMKVLNSEYAKHRAAALYAISNLDYACAKEISFELLNDKSNTVKKSCASIIPKDTANQDLEKLRTIYDKGDDETKRFVLKIINKYGGWDIVGDFLKGIIEPNKKLNEISLAFLNGWYYYSIRLATEQKVKDKEYVLGIYNKIDFEKLKSPYDIRKITDRIPFIFGQK